MPPGRPRTFDPEEVLEKALRVFWQKGYEGTSMPDLTEAMGINRPSIYAAFGNKENLFRKALDLYIERMLLRVRDALSNSLASEGMRRILTEMANALAASDKPKGCLLVQGALTCSEAAEDIRKELAIHRKDVEHLLRDRFLQAYREGELPPGADPVALAKFMATVMHGISVQASSGANASDLLSIAHMAMQAWPK
jgi:AcrR family transcriptional regulator